MTAESHAASIRSDLSHPNYFEALQAYEDASTKLQQLERIPEEDRELWGRILPWAKLHQEARLAVLSGDMVKFGDLVAQFSQNRGAFSSEYIPKISFLFHIAIASNLEIQNYDEFHSWYSIAKSNGMLGVGITDQEELMLNASFYFSNRDRKSLLKLTARKDTKDLRSAAYAAWLLAKLTEDVTNINSAVSLYSTVIREPQDEVRLVELEMLLFGRRKVANSRASDLQLFEDFAKLEKRILQVQAGIDPLIFPLIYSQSLKVLSELYWAASILMPQRSGYFKTHQTHIDEAISKYR